MIVTEIKFDDSARLHLVVEIPETESFSTTHMPHMPRILFRMFPYLASQKCNNDHGQSFRREAMATEIPHLFEHLTLEIQKQVRAGVFWDTSIKGETEWNWTIDPRGRFHVTLGYDSEIVALASVRLAERIINALDSREIIAIDIDREMRRLRELARASRNSKVRALVVGMHKALPDSISDGHSMNESPAGNVSGRRVYKMLVDFHNQTEKNVYVLASHSHFFMDNVYDTACRRPAPNTILPGWIVGTAGAVRYRLPADVTGANQAKTDVYGYLIGEVHPDGTVRFQFKQLVDADVPVETRQKYTDNLVRSCFSLNSSRDIPAGPPQPPNCP